jgi:hypothetical protein
MTNTNGSNNTNTSVETIHVFEGAGLGKAPFRLAQVDRHGDACQFCGTGILFRFHIEGSDGRRFYVGSDCVMKTGDVGLMRKVEHEVKKHQAELRHERERAKLAALRDFLASAENQAALSAKPHPFFFRANRGETLFNYAEWIMKYGGTTARMKLAKALLPAEPRGRKKAAAAA